MAGIVLVAGNRVVNRMFRAPDLKEITVLMRHPLKLLMMKNFKPSQNWADYRNELSSTHHSDSSVNTVWPHLLCTAPTSFSESFES